MIAVDTNVLVRLLVGDDGRQGAATRALLAQERALLLPTVLQETVWVLESLYGLGRPRVLECLEALFGLEAIAPWNEAAATASYDGYRAGLDFADALHLALASQAGASAFLTFDQKFIRKARRVDDSIVVRAP